MRFATTLGLFVIAIDARDEGLQLAKDREADMVVDARQLKEKAVEEVKKVTGDQGADATLNVSDDRIAAALATAVTKRHGYMTQIAQPLEVSIAFTDLCSVTLRCREVLPVREDDMLGRA